MLNTLNSNMFWSLNRNIRLSSPIVFSDNFDSYTNGESVETVPNWKAVLNFMQFYKPSADGYVVSATGTLETAVHYIASLNNNQWSQARLDSWSSDIGVVGVAVRCSSTVTFSDNFDSYVDGYNLVSSNDWGWSDNTNTFRVNKPVADGAVYPSLGISPAALYYSRGFNADQWSQITCDAVTAGVYMGISVRVEPYTGIHGGGYSYAWISDSSGSYCYKMVGGTPTTLVSGGAAFVVGHKYRLSAEGSTLSFYDNDVLDTTMNGTGHYLDNSSPILTGYPGIAGKGSGTGTLIDLWRAGDLHVNYYGFYGTGAASTSINRYLFKTVDGVWTEIQRIAKPFVSGNTYKLEVIGNELRCYENGVLDTDFGTLGVSIDNDLTSGYAGLCGYGSTTANRLDLWSGGNV
jgi:hypothetical protein